MSKFPFYTILLSKRSRNTHVFVDADNVLRLEIEMYDVVEGEVLDPLADLAHDPKDVLLGKVRLVQNDPLEELTAGEVFQHWKKSADIRNLMSFEM